MIMGSTDQSYVSSIQLPDTNIVFRNLKKAKRFAIDIGKFFHLTCLLLE